MGKILVLDFFRNFIFFTEGSCEHIMNDQALLIISIMTEKWFRKIVFNLTGVHMCSLILYAINKNVFFYMPDTIGF